ncbi:MAG TPA: hypothetical protein H9675_08010 [Firmicutes bacterium]|nr:hypothetical protein [Bacillota bacterium]
MDNLAAQISELLESPDGMDKIREMASMLMTSDTQQDPPPDSSPTDIDMDKLRDIASSLMGQQSAANTNNASQGSSVLSPGDMKVMMKLMQALRSDATDERSRLLMSLRPYLSEKRQARVDSAVKILRLVQLIPLLSESGFSLF